MAENAAETRAIALFGMTLAQGLVATLEAKGILSQAQVDQLLAGVLASFENLPVQDEGAQHARQMIENIAAIVSQSRHNDAK